MKLNIEEVLEKEGVYVSTTVGVSMYPMLRDRKDTIIVSPCKGRLKKYDVPLYKRGNAYVLHRIIEVKKDSYVIRGDNCMQKEYDITDEKILGVLTGFYRDDKEVNMNGLAYKCYARIWHAIFPLRYFVWRVKGFIKRRILKWEK